MEERIDNPSGSDGPRPLRVLACSGSLDGGGSERQLWQLVSRLDRRRFSPEVYLLVRRGPYLERLPGDVPVHAFDGVHPAPPRFPPGRISRLQSQHLRQVVRSRRIDVVYDRTFHMTLLTGWALPAWQPRVSVIVSPPSRDLPGSERRWLFLKRWLLARAYRSASTTICVSSEVADDAARYYGLSRERLTVMHNPVDVDAVRRLAAAPLSVDDAEILHKSAESSLRVVVVGRFTAEKGHRFALELLRQFRTQLAHGSKSLHLHLIGDGPMKAELESLRSAWGLEACVHLHGYQTNPYPLMAACDLVLVPSRYEGFPNVAMEAMALGVPLLMTNYGPTASAIAGADNERGVLIPLDELNDAVRAIKDRMEHASMWLARAAVAQAWIEREHALWPWLENMMGLLEEVATGKRRSG